MKLVLVCYSGSSASILKDRMLAWARANLLDVEIIVSSLAGLDEDKEDADIVLVGPQVRCALASVRERVPERIPVMAVRLLFSPEIRKGVLTDGKRQHI